LAEDAVQKTLVILSCALVFGAAGILKASPLDSLDIVYIDGQPCNSACQSYMAWSRQIVPVPGHPSHVSTRAAARQQSPNELARRLTRIREAGSRPAVSDRTAKQVAPTSAGMPQAKITDSPPAGKTADDGQSASSGSVRHAIVKAGAAEVELTGNQTKALDRMFGGEVPRPVLTLASPEPRKDFLKSQASGFFECRSPAVRCQRTHHDKREVAPFTVIEISELRFDSELAAVSAAR
jgi:hypothetical protein